MATDGTPEAAAKRCGEAIARLRTLRGWSRAQLIIRLYNELPHDDPCVDSISETWLARLENGRMVKVPRQIVEALCRALRCSPKERAYVLLHADRNVLADPDPEAAPTPVAEALTYVMERLDAEAHDLLADVAGQHPATVDELELLEGTLMALQLLIARRRQRQNVVSSASLVASSYLAASGRRT
jgi:transcriptional regulator with XRE-family HTH domain